jgi:hypothetical protein
VAAPPHAHSSNSPGSKAPQASPTFESPTTPVSGSFSMRVANRSGMDIALQFYSLARKDREWPGPPAGRRGDDGCVPGVRHLAQDRLQDFRSLQGARPRGAERSTRFSIATAWSSAAAPRASVRAARRCRRVPCPTTCGAPTSREGSSSATGATAIR